ncbi:MAG: NADH-quinone oxidoreductase subunit D-related protein [Thermoplasmataceae archaeon]
MKYYRFGEPSGRPIGYSQGFRVYPSVITRQDEVVKQPERKAAPHGEFYFGYGPSTGGMIESVGVDFLTPGELISEVYVNPAYKHRKIAIRGRSIGDASLIVERINAFHCASHSIAFSSAVEDALGLEVPEGIGYTRIIAAELERIRSNLLVIERMCQPAGFGVPANQLATLREEVSRIISRATGHRYFFNSIYPGYSMADLSGIENEVNRISKSFSGIYDDLLESKIFMNRLINNGRISSDLLLGPAARASGRAYDARIDSPTLSYSRFGLTPVLHETSDAFARFQVRSEEILQSAQIIEEAADVAKPGGKIEKLEGDGEGAARVESPQGDLFYYVRIENSIIRDINMLSPSSSNIEAFSQSMKDNIFTDFHFNWESFGIWISEIGVTLE